MAARAHAGRISLAILLIVFLIVVEPIERPAGRADQPTDRRARACTTSPASDRAPGGPDGRTAHASDRSVFYHLHRLVSLANLRGRVLVAGIDARLRGRCRTRCPHGARRDTRRW